METLPKILIGVVAAIHILIAAVEMLLWRQPAVHRRLGFDSLQAEKAYPIVANAGLYNSFLALGLIWGLAGAATPIDVSTFFLSCVFVAGFFGAVTLKWTVFVIQSLPAAAALAALWLFR